MEDLREWEEGFDCQAEVAEKGGVEGSYGCWRVGG